MNDPRYPVGKFDRREELSPPERRAMIEDISVVPMRMREAITGLTPAQLDTPYREGGWTLRQVVHHVPDSHLNGYIRFKLGLTEELPAIKPYDEARWAELPDTHDTPVKTSLLMLDALHDRWVRLLKSMKPADFQRKLTHPENGEMTLDAVLGLYAWHGRHHVAHITSARERLGW
jgi:uncharacterized damage-inducible protein DinB